MLREGVLNKLHDFSYLSILCNVLREFPEMLTGWSITRCVFKIGGELSTCGRFLERLDGAYLWFIFYFCHMIAHLTQNFVSLIAFFDTHLQIVTKMHFSSSFLRLSCLCSLSSSCFFLRACDRDLVTLCMVLNNHITSCFLLLFFLFLNNGQIRWPVGQFSESRGRLAMLWLFGAALGNVLGSRCSKKNLVFR